MQRRRFKQSLLLNRLADRAKIAQEKAKDLPPGQERETLLNLAKQSDIASQIDRWLSSRGLQPPK